MRIAHLRAVSFLGAVASVSLAAQAEELRIAVAANFHSTLQALAPLYEQRSGHRLALSSAASGLLYAQINEGAPFDVFLSADGERAEALLRTGRAIAEEQCTYAIGRLVLWSPDNKRFIDGAAYLRRGQFRHLAIADPDAAPFGAAARELLTEMQLWQSLQQRRKLVMGANVAQAQQFAASGGAEAAFISLAQVLALPAATRGSFWQPISPAARLPQQGVVLQAASSREAARDFLRWLCADESARGQIAAAGYALAKP